MTSRADLGGRIVPSMQLGPWNSYVSSLFPELYPLALRRVCYYFAPPPASVSLRPRRSFVPLSFVKFEIKRRNTWGGIINRITLQRSGRRR